MDLKPHIRAQNIHFYYKQYSITFYGNSWSGFLTTTHSELSLQIIYYIHRIRENILQRVYWTRLCQKFEKRTRMIIHYHHSETPTSFFLLSRPIFNRIIGMGLGDVNECSLFEWIWKGTAHVCSAYALLVWRGGGA